MSYSLSFKEDVGEDNIIIFSILNCTYNYDIHRILHKTLCYIVIIACSHLPYLVTHSSSRLNLSHNNQKMKLISTAYCFEHTVAEEEIELIYT